MTPPRVLWLTKGLGRGGAEQLLVGSAALVDRSRYDVEVAYTVAEKDALVAQLRDSGTVVHALGSGAREASWAARLRRLLHDGRFDLVHTHAPVPAAAARALAPRRVCFVHTEHNTWSRYRRATRWANAATYRRNAAVLAVSSGVADSIDPRALRSPATLRVLHHGIDHATIRHGEQARREARSLLGLPVDVPVVGCVANFTPKKDHLTLLEAHARLEGTHLVLVGTGPLEERLKARAAELGTGSQVHWLGMRADVPQLLAGFDAFCLSSLHEGLPISLLEAMAAEVPPVVTRVGGVPEVVTDGVNGLLVPPSSPGELAAALSEVLTAPARAHELAVAARARAGDFSLVNAVREIEKTYDEVLA